MKNISLICFFIFSFTQILVSQNSCEINPILYDYYGQDVAHLAIMEMEKVNSTDLAFANISDTWQEPIWEGLSAIFNSSSTGRDDVFDIYCIHHYGNSFNSLRIFHKMYVNPDPNVSWFSNWENGNLETYNDEFNAFLERWEFEYDGQLLSSFRIKTDRNINMLPLADTLDMMDSINFAERQPYIGGGNQILYEKSGNLRFYDFSVGWQDCPSGCILSHSWSFSVDENCEVVFQGESGNPDIPEWLKRNCDISSLTNVDLITESMINILPNPMSNFLTIKIDNPNQENLSFEVRDIIGNKVFEGKVKSDISINTTDLMNGLYFVSIMDGKKIIKTEKIIKN